MGRAPHLPVVGETVKGSTFKIGPGGKGSNQGVAAKRAGGDVTMITKIGADSFADLALNSFRNEGMSTEFVFKDEKAATGAALIMVDENSSDNKILVTLGACNFITEEDIEKARPSIESAGVFLTQLETNLDAVQRAIDIAHGKGAIVILNPAPASPISDELLGKVDVLTPNEVEASIISGVEVATVEDAAKAGRVLIEKGVGSVIVTMGSQGSLVVTRDGEEFIESAKVDAIDTTGAGDAYNGGLATALAEGKDIVAAARFANITGSLSVTKIGTAPAMPYRNKIDKMMKEVYGE
ncbi:MAG: ribokinase, partial [Victivallales bacterium]|nr:ribokinase [Victivallales bacterium]